MAVVVIAAAFQWLTSPLPSPLDPSFDSWQRASLAPGSPVLRWAAPLAGTPMLRGFPPHALIAAPLPGPADDGTSAWRTSAAALVAVFAGVFTLALRRMGCHPLAAAAGALVLPLAGLFRGDPFTSVESAFTATLLAVSLLTTLLYRNDGRPTWAVASILLLCVAVDNRLSWWPLALPWWVLLAGNPEGSRDVAPGPVGQGVSLAGRLPESHRRRLAALMTAGLLLATAHALAAAWFTLAAAPAGPGQAGEAPRLSEVVRLAVFGVTAAGRASSSLEPLRALTNVAYTVFGLPGLGLALAGAVAVARRRSLAVAGVACLVALLLLAAASSPVPASPAVLALLLLVATALAAGSHAVLRLPGRAATTGAVLLVLLVPSLQAARRHPADAWSAARALTVSRDALASALGPRPALVADLPPLDRALLPLPGLVRVPPDDAVARRFATSGLNVYALERARIELEARGLVFQAVPLACRSLEAYLSSMPPGSVTALASSPGRPAGVVYSPATGASTIGAPEKVGAWMTRAVCLVGVAGASSGAVDAAAEDAASLRVPANTGVSNRDVLVPATLRLSADASGARVQADDRWFVSSRPGLALAVLDGGGNLWDARVVDETTAFLLAPPDARLGASRLGGSSPACQDVREGAPVDVTALARDAAIGWSLDRPSPGSLVLHAFAETSLAPTARGEREDLVVDSFAPGDPALAARMSDDGLSPASAPLWPSVRVQVPLAGRPAWGSVLLGGVPPKVLAVARGTGGRVVRLCASGIGPDVLFAAGAQRAADLGAGRHRDPRFGAGWSPREFAGATPFRWTGARAVLLLRLPRVRALRVAVDATAAARGTPVDVSLVVNTRVLPACALTGDPTTCEWVVEADAWVEGLNQLEFRVSRTEKIGRDPRLLGMAVRGVRVERVE